MKKHKLSNSIIRKILNYVFSRNKRGRFSMFILESLIKIILFIIVIAIYAIPMFLGIISIVNKVFDNHPTKDELSTSSLILSSICIVFVVESMFHLIRNIRIEYYTKLKK